LRAGLVGYTLRVDDLDKRIKRNARKLVAVSVAIGFLLGFVVGAFVAQGNRIVVIPLTPGTKT